MEETLSFEGGGDVGGSLLSRVLYLLFLCTLRHSSVCPFIFPID